MIRAPTPTPTPKPLEGWATCKRCRLHKHRRQVVFGRGTIPAEILFIGEAPGKSEDLRGEAFIGRSGRLLDTMLAEAVRLAGREANPPTYYITNVVACIPRDASAGELREPKRDEELACWPRLQITARLVDPEYTILLGSVARNFAAARFPGALTVVHPAYILRRGGTGATEYRTTVRELADTIRARPAPRLAPRDVFGDAIR